MLVLSKDQSKTTSQGTEIMKALDKVEIGLIFGAGLWLCGILLYFTIDTYPVLKKQDRLVTQQYEECEQ